MLAAPMLLARLIRTRGRREDGAPALPRPRAPGRRRDRAQAGRARILPNLARLAVLARLAAPVLALAPVSTALAAGPAELSPGPAAATPPLSSGPADPAATSLSSGPAPLSGPAAPPAPPQPEPADPTAAPTPAPPRLGERRPLRRWALGVEGVALQIPPLRPRVAHLDARYLGASATLGGVGVVGRVRVVPELALELAVRSGSLRYRSHGDLISQDLLLAELGALLFLARGDIGHFALDAGVGGLGHAIRYELADGRGGRQLVGAFTVRVGADLELQLGRVALTFSLRGYGVVTDAARTRATGALFAGASDADRRAPLPRYQTYLLGSAGLLYRF